MQRSVGGLLAALVALAVGVSPASAEIFKYRDAAGSPVFTDRELAVEETRERGLVLYGSEESSPPAVAPPAPAPVDPSSCVQEIECLVKGLGAVPAPGQAGDGGGVFRHGRADRDAARRDLDPLIAEGCRVQAVAPWERRGEEASAMRVTCRDGGGLLLVLDRENLDIRREPAP